LKEKVDYIVKKKEPVKEFSQGGTKNIANRTHTRGGELAHQI